MRGIVCSAVVFGVVAALAMSPAMASDRGDGRASGVNPFAYGSIDVPVPLFGQGGQMLYRPGFPYDSFVQPPRGPAVPFFLFERFQDHSRRPAFPRRPRSPRRRHGDRRSGFDLWMEFDW